MASGGARGRPDAGRVRRAMCSPATCGGGARRVADGEAGLGGSRRALPPVPPCWRAGEDVADAVCRLERRPSVQGGRAARQVHKRVTRCGSSPVASRVTARCRDGGGGRARCRRTSHPRGERWRWPGRPRSPFQSHGRSAAARSRAMRARCRLLLSSTVHRRKGPATRPTRADGRAGRGSAADIVIPRMSRRARGSRRTREGAGRRNEGLMGKRSRRRTGGERGASWLKNQAGATFDWGCWPRVGQRAAERLAVEPALGRAIRRAAASVVGKNLRA